MKYKKMTILNIFFVILLICSLSAISAANNNTINSTSTGGIAQGITDTNEGTLFLQPGTYNRTGQDTNITINKNITIQGNGSTGSVIIDAQGLSRIFTINNNLNVTFINITFTNGYSGSANSGAIYNSNRATIMTAINCIFTNNQAPNNQGGAISNSGNNMVIDGCTFINNTANNRGGAILVSFGINASISNSNFINNSVSGSSTASYGGAVHFANGAGMNVTVFRCNFVNNTGGTGGGIFIVDPSSYTISACNFIGNKAINGGAINVGSSTDPTLPCIIINCNFVSNTANTYAGAIISDSINLTIINCNFINNTAGTTGGAVQNAARGNMTLIGNTMSGNVAILGQEIYNLGKMGVLNLTFVDNSTWVVKNGSTITLYATLTDDMGNTVTGQNISFYLDGVFFENVTSIEGYANISYTVPSNADDIPVSGEYAGNGAFNILINNGLLKVRIPTKITISVPQDLKVGDTVTLESKLTDEDGNPLAGKTVDFYVDGKKVGSGVTDKDGIAKLNYTFNKAGKPKVEAKFTGDNTYLASNATNQTTVSKIPTNTIVKTDKNTIIVTLTDEDGNQLANKKVTITVNGKTYTKTTNSQGQVIIKYKNAWDYKVTANFAGDEKYLASKATAPKRTPTKITIKTKGDKITATLTDKNGKPLSGKKLTFRVKGVIIGVGITDANGQVVIYYKNADKKAVTVSFEGDSEYMPSNATSTPVSENVQASGKVTMKNTGIPIIAILLALMASFSLVNLRKRE